MISTYDNQTGDGQWLRQSLEILKGEIGMICQNCLEQADECICGIIKKANSEPKWISARLKPTNSRRVRLKFEDGSEADGFFWSAEGLWYLSDGSKAKRNAVQPASWAEIEVAL